MSNGDRKPVKADVKVGPKAHVRAIGPAKAAEHHAEFDVDSRGSLIIHIEDVEADGPFDIETAGPDVFVKVGKNQFEGSGQIVRIVAYRTNSSDVIVDSNC